MSPLRANSSSIHSTSVGLGLILIAGAVGIVIGVKLSGPNQSIPALGSLPTEAARDPSHKPGRTTPDRATVLETTLRVVHAIAEQPNDEICSRFPQVVHASAFRDGQRSCNTLSVATIRVLTECGIAARGVNLYNLPNQGNHSILEVQLDDNEWILVDPTFGVVFLPDIAGRGRSLDEVRGLPDENAVAAILLRSTAGDSWARPLAELFVPGFPKGRYMAPGHYLAAEATGSWHPDQRVVLSWNIAPGGHKLGISTVDPDRDSRQKAFLDWTNRRLRDDDPANDISFLASRVGGFSKGIFTPTISLPSLTHGEVVRLRIRGERLGGNGGLRLIPVGGSVDVVGAANPDRPLTKVASDGRFEIDFWLSGRGMLPRLLVETDKDTQYRIFGMDHLIEVPPANLAAPQKLRSC